MTRTFRNRTFPVIGWVCVVPLALAAIGCLVGAIVADVPLVGRGWLLLGTAASTALAVVVRRGYIATRVEATGEGVVVVNPWRTETLAWGDVLGFSADTHLVVHRRQGPKIRVFAVQAANLARMLGRESHADHVARDLNGLLAEHGGPSRASLDQEYELTPEKRRTLRRQALGVAAAMAVLFVVRVLVDR
ncbi:MAG TPA: PH domain-containing protein [Acidimicrobiales bacterium]|nr:PH domain-containing protein [Acidimicrobiales bacterium]